MGGIECLQRKDMMSDLVAAQTMGFAETRDGIRLSYSLTPGKGEGRCVLIHSLAMDKFFWDATVAALAGAAEVLVYDCRGHGVSGKPDEAYSAQQFADDLADLMDHIGWPSAVVAGASMGGSIAIAFAAAYPRRVEALGLFDTTCWYGEDALKAWTERGNKALNEGFKSLIAFQKTRWFSDGFREASPNVVEAAASTFLANELKAYAATCTMLGVVDLRSALPVFDFPCRVLVGTEDYATPPEMARYLADNIPGAKLTILEGARHLSPLEVPDVIAENLRLLLEAAKG